jgi:hypothetical protein
LPNEEDKWLVILRSVWNTIPIAGIEPSTTDEGADPPTRPTASSTCATTMCTLDIRRHRNRNRPGLSRHGIEALLDAALKVAKEKHKHIHGEGLDRAGREGVE